MQHLLALQVLLCSWSVVLPFCPSQCTCVFLGTRMVLCNDPDMSDIPMNVPLDTMKLRVEKTAVRRVKTEAFYYLTELKYLWLTYNSISTVDPGSFYNLKVLHELRMDGNQISMFPWEALKEMPNLRTLDLHNNRLMSVPVEAAAYLMNITYLDISSNRLNTLSSELLDIWSPFASIIPTVNANSKVILGLHDNLWYCDCRISKLIEISKMGDPPVVLMDPFVTCSGPENLAGVLFDKAELDQCVKPKVITSATKITSPLGSNVLMRCDATGYPTPTLIWYKEDGFPIRNPAVQESPGEGVRWSILSLHGIKLNNAGIYRCKAKNVAGTMEASVTLSVIGMNMTTPSALNVTKKPDDGPGMVTQSFPFSDTVIPSTSFSTFLITKQLVTTVLPIQTKIDSGPGEGIQRSPPDGDMASTMEKNKNYKSTVSKEKAGKKGSSSIKNIEVVEATGNSAVVLWTNNGFPSEASLSVVYFPYDAEEMKYTVETKFGNGKILLKDLFPNQIYTVCLVAKDLKDQCVNFSTLDTMKGDNQNKWLIVLSGIACVFTLSIILILVYNIATLYCKRSTTREAGTEELFKETYVKFETLPMRQRTLNGPTNDLWTRRQTQESERMLLCSRSSIDSQMTYKSDSSRSEYLF